MLLSNDPCAKNEVSPTIDQKNVRVWSQGIKSFLFCCSLPFKRVVGQHFKMLLIILVSLFIAEREIKTISLPPAATARGEQHSAGRRPVALEPDCLASFLGDPLWRE